jgi:hypothetical protein
MTWAFSARRSAACLAANLLLRGSKMYRFTMAAAAVGTIKDPARNCNEGSAAKSTGTEND